MNTRWLRRALISIQFLTVAQLALGSEANTPQVPPALTGEERKRAIAEAVTTTRDLRPEAAQGVVWALETLGYLKAIEVADVIVDKLDFHHPMSNDMSFLKYPALQALIRIGPQAMPSLVEYFANKEPSLVFLQNAFELLTTWYGSKEEAQNQFEKQIEAYRTKLKKLEEFKKNVLDKGGVQLQWEEPKGK